MNMKHQTHTPVKIDREPPVIEDATMSFYEALRLTATRGAKITKTEWKDKGVYGMMKDAVLQIYMDGREGKKFYHWILNEGDISGTDWIVVE